MPSRPARPPSCGTCSRCATAPGRCWTPRPPRPRTPPRSAGLRAELGRRYDRYLAAYGPLNRFSLRRTGRTDPATGEPVMARIRPPQGGFAADPFAPLVYALEQFDPVGQRAAKAAIFRERVIAPRAPRLGADTPADALAICLDTRGEVAAGRDRPAARHHRGRRPRAARHAGVRRPGNRPAGARRRVPVRQRPREAAARRAGGRGRPPVRGQRRRTAPGHPGRPDARGDRRPARRGLDRRDVRPAVPARDPRRPAACGSSIPAGRSGRSAATRHTVPRPLHLGHQPLPGTAALAQAVLEQRRIEVHDTRHRRRMARTVRS